MDELLLDLRFGLRSLRESPGFTTVSILVLAVGIGSTVAIFGLVNSVLLRPLPYPHPEELVSLLDAQGNGQAPMSYQEYRAWKEQGGAFQHVAAAFDTTATLTGTGDPEELRVLRVSASLLPMLQVMPMLGRNFLTEEEPREGAPAVVLTNAFWQERFHGDPGVLGRSLVLADRVHTIVGVLPADFKFGAKPQVLVPLRLNDTVAFLSLYG